MFYSVIVPPPATPILSIKIYGSRNETNYIHKTNIMKTHVKV